MVHPKQFLVSVFIGLAYIQVNICLSLQFVLLLTDLRLKLHLKLFICYLIAEKALKGIYY